MSDAGDKIRTARLAAGLTQGQLARRASTSQPAVHRYEQGKVTPTATTAQRLITACRSRPLPRDVLERNRARVLEVVNAHGFRSVRVFGSVARHEDEDGSDIDLLVDDPARPVTLLDLIGLQQDLEEILELGVDVSTVEMLRPRIREHVLADARPL